MKRTKNFTRNFDVVDTTSKQRICRRQRQDDGGFQSAFQVLRMTGTETFGMPPGGGVVLPYMGYIGMCGPKGYGFSAVLVINRVSILADFGHFGHK